MALEVAVPAGPVSAEQPEEDGGELAAMRLRFWLCLPATLVVMFLGMQEMLGTVGRSFTIAESNSLYVQAVLSAFVILYGGGPFLARAWRSLVTWRLNMFTLIGIGSAVAFVYSLVAALEPAWIPAGFHGTSGTPPVFFESSAVIITLVLLGQWLELRARRRNSDAIRSLYDLQPTTALRMREGGEEEVPLSVIGPEERIRVRPGARVAVDGVVVDGESSVDESMMSGEAMPALKRIGDIVLAGTVNEAGSLIVEVTRTGDDTILASIIRRVAEAQRSRAPVQQFADRVSARFVPAVMFIAVVSFVVWAFVGPQPRLSYALLSAISVLIIACPCALGLATPMSVTVGMGRAARAGVLFQDAEALERLGEIDTLLMDKTGTLTEGKPRVSAMITRDPGEQDRLLARLAAVERASEHPIASAIVRSAEEKGLSIPLASGVQIRPGRGVAGQVEGNRISIGNEALMEAEGVNCAELAEQVEHLRSEGKTVLYFAVDKQVAGAVAVEDPLKADAQEVVGKLQRAGIRVVLLTGDREATTKVIANKLGISEYDAEVLPEQKADSVERMRAQGQIVGMVGDGINDAPALASADVGIAMGNGTDIAMDSAKVVLVHGDLQGLLRARKLSRLAMSNIRQNLLLAFLYNALAIPIAAGALYPVIGMVLSPMIAAAAMSFSSLSVIGNALRLRGARL
jgi:Cu+-exporting ATPase